MAKVEKNYTIELNTKEACIFKCLLGSISTKEFSHMGINGDRRSMLHKVWEMLPKDEDD